MQAAEVSLPAGGDSNGMDLDSRSFEYDGERESCNVDLALQAFGDAFNIPQQHVTQEAGSAQEAMVSCMDTTSVGVSPTPAGDDISQDHATLCFLCSISTQVQISV